MDDLLNYFIKKANILYSDIQLLEEKLSSANKGTIFIRKMRNKKFVYRKYKIHNKVYADYLGPLGSDSASLGIKEYLEYKKIKEKLKIKKENFRDLKKMINVARHRRPNFINKKTKIDFEVSKTMKGLISKADEADLLNNYGTYMNYAYAIDAQAKKETGKRILTESQWNKLSKRYCL